MAEKHNKKEKGWAEEFEKGIEKGTKTINSPLRKLVFITEWKPCSQEKK